MKYNYYKKIKLLSKDQQEFLQSEDWRTIELYCRNCKKRVFKYTIIENSEILKSHEYYRGGGSTILCPDCYEPDNEDDFDYETNGWNRCCVCGELQSSDRLEYYKGDWYCHTDDNTCLPEEYWDDDYDDDYDDEYEKEFNWNDPDEVIDNIDFANGWG